jgi:hypothetical protein
MPDLRIAGLEQDSSSAIQRDIQQGAVPLKVVPRHKEPLPAYIQNALAGRQASETKHSLAKRLLSADRQEPEREIVFCSPVKHQAGGTDCLLLCFRCAGQLALLVDSAPDLSSGPPISQLRTMVRIWTSVRNQA